MMANSPRDPPRQPKFRSSCDGCGAVKGKCDRQHPECGRCMAHGIKCTYGISKKVGKPRRDRSVNTTNTKNSPSTSTGTNNSTTSENMSTGTSMSTSLSASTSTSTGLDSMMSYAWDNSNNDNDHGILNMDFCFPDGMSDTSLHSNLFPSIAFSDWLGPDNLDTVVANVHNIERCGKLDLSDHGPYGHQQPDTSATCGASSSSGARDHDCHREAHELLGASLFANPGLSLGSTTKHIGNSGVSSSTHVEVKTASVPTHTLASYFDSDSSGVHGVALDQVLLLNRKAIEQLASLLACSCAASPYLMILYSSLISAILMRCEHAAGSSATSTPLNTPGGSVALARISIGAFRVDDPRIQSALNIQLLAGELRTVAGLIDTIASYECNNNKVMGEQSGGTNVPRLYQNLAMWLKNEHSRVTDIVANRLRELNS